VLLAQLHLEGGREVGGQPVLLRQFVGLREFVDLVEELQTVREEALADVDDAHLLGFVVELLVLGVLLVRAVIEEEVLDLLHPRQVLYHLQVNVLDLLLAVLLTQTHLLVFLTFLFKSVQCVLLLVLV